MKYILSAIVLFLAVESRAASVETPTMGWSSWNAFRVNISERTIKHHADLVKELELDKCGYVYINIDDGYFGGRDEAGRIKTHPKRFPNGLKPVVDHIHSLGLKAGLPHGVYQIDQSVGTVDHRKRTAIFQHLSPRMAEVVNRSRNLVASYIFLILEIFFTACRFHIRRV